MKRLSPKYIMIIDDSEDNIELIQFLLKHRGFEVLSARDGREALQILATVKVLPHLILLDANMPIMNGFEFRNQQKKDARIASIPVIVMSGDIDLELQKRMLRPECILAKPIQVQRFIAEVTNHMR